MAPQQIYKTLHSKPFKPFRLVLTDGKEFDVTDATHIYVSGIEVAVGVEPDEYGVPARSIYVDPFHVTRIEPLGTPVREDDIERDRRGSN